MNPDTMSGILPLSESTRTLCIAGFTFIASLIDLTLPCFSAAASMLPMKQSEKMWI